MYPTHILERMTFADRRTSLMSSTEYQVYILLRNDETGLARGKKRRTLLCHLLTLHPSCMDALIILSFIAHDRIGIIIEQAIRSLTGGVLYAMSSPLPVEAIVSSIKQLKNNEK